MSMQEWPDDHLDELFRKSAEEFDPPFESAHWDDMNNRLDQQDRQAFYDRLRLWGSAGALTGLLLITLWWAWQVTNVATVTATKRTDGKEVSAKKTITSSTQPNLKPALDNPVNVPTIPTKRAATDRPEKQTKQTGDLSEAYNAKNSATAAGSPNSSPARIAATESRPTSTAPARGVVTPDWAVRSRKTAGQWRRPMPTYLARKPTVALPMAVQPPGPSVSARAKKAYREEVDQQQKKSISELETTLNQPLESAQSQTSAQATGTSNQPAKQPFSQPQPATQVRNLPVAGQPTSTETTTPTAHRSTGTPGYTSSTRMPAPHSGGLSDQSQPAKPADNQPGSTVENAAVQPDAQLADRLHFLDIGAAQSLTTVKAVLTQAMPEPEWEAPERPLIQPVRQPSRLSIMAVVSPDLSAIEIQDLARPGTNFGVMAQYRLSNRVVVQTGAMISTKKYQTTSEYYVWPSTWTWDPWPSNINGTCTMIDMPLNVRYDWLLRPRGDGRLPARWFASTGLTSYFIKREIYTYDYADPSDPRIKYLGWDNQKAGVPGGKFGFSNLNVSVGYERPISRHLSWQVEPFVKIPLKQVGFFKVRLISSGVFFGLKYSF